MIINTVLFAFFGVSVFLAFFCVVYGVVSLIDRSDKGE